MRITLLFSILLISVFVAAQAIVIPDSTFNGTGRKVFTVGANLDFGDNIALQPDGKMIMTGASMNNGGMAKLGICRLDTDGNFDDTFGAAGISLIDLGGQPSQGGFEPEIVVLPDGKIVICGYGWNGTDEDMFICRLLADGSLDPEFGTAGKVFIGFMSVGMPDAACAVTADAAGNIYACGSTRTGATPFTNDVAIVKLTSAGIPDPSFSDDGKLLLDLSGEWDFGYGIAAMDDGKVIVTGFAGFPADFFAIRLMPDGSYDTSFGTGGKTTVDVSGSNVADESWGMTLTADGKIIMVGDTYSTSTGTFDAVVVCLTTSGMLDETFSNDGIATFQISAETTVMRNAIVQPDGKLVVSGSAIMNGNEDYAVLRLNPDGTPDQTFNTTGIYTIDVTGDQKGDIGYGLALQNDGKILLSGNTSISQYINEKYSIVRLVAIDPSVSVVEASTVDPLLIYPNPAQSHITVKINGMTGPDKQLRLIDVTGRCVKDLALSNEGDLTQNLDISNLKNGIYTLLYVNDGKVVSQTRVIKN